MASNHGEIPVKIVMSGEIVIGGWYSPAGPFDAPPGQHTVTWDNGTYAHVWQHWPVWWPDAEIRAYLNLPEGNERRAFAAQMRTRKSQGEFG